MGKVIKLKQPEFSDVAARKIESSGLTLQQATQLGMYSVANATALDTQFEIEPALVIPYYDLEGRPLRARSNWPEFYRIRYLGEGKAHGFAEAAGVKESRYSQPRNTGVCAYFPQINADWKSLRAEVSEPLLVTEGELKAAKATVEGFPTIGLGGVYNFKQTSQGIFFLPELEAFDWRRRKVTIVYDSDYMEKPQICTAINTLAEELFERGALVHVATLEDVYEEKGRKTGLDDFLVERSDVDLVELLARAEPLGMTRRLWQMNEEIVYIRDPGMVVVQDNTQKLDCSKFASHSDWATQTVPERRLNLKGQIAIEKAAAAPVWLKWPLRNAVDKVSYLPGRERFAPNDRGELCFNQWKGWGTTPHKGDVTPWLDLTKFIFRGAEKGALEWFYDWLAYPLQNPGAKLFSAVIIHGRVTGTGKSLIGYSMKPIYGDNWMKIKKEELKDTWWAENRQFVLGDEITGSDKRSEADAMKAMITQEEVNVNIKYIPQFSIPDCVNYYLTSNHCDALFVEDEDRRYFVIEVQADKPLSDSFYVDYDRWLKEEGGAAALMHWLLQRDLTDFNPKAKAFRTSARDRMVRASKSDLEAWCLELREAPVNKLRIGQMRHVRDLFTSRELLSMYEADNPQAVGKVTAGGVAKKLSGAGFKQAYLGQPITNRDKRQDRYFIIRNDERWVGVKDGKALSRHVSLQPIRD